MRTLAFYLVSKLLALAAALVIVSPFAHADDALPKDWRGVVGCYEVRFEDKASGPAPKTFCFRQFQDGGYRTPVKLKAIQVSFQRFFAEGPSCYVSNQVTVSERGSESGQFTLLAEFDEVRIEMTGDAVSGRIQLATWDAHAGKGHWRRGGTYRQMRQYPAKSNLSAECGGELDGDI